MKKLYIKTIWQGRAAVRDKYVKEFAGKEDLRIIHKSTGDYMTIPKEGIAKKVAAWSAESFKNHFSGTSHRLAYFDWKPDVNRQTKLI